MENIKIRVTPTFMEITPEDGYVITDWDGVEILDYSSTTMLVTPLEYDYSAYYTVTVEEDARLLAELENKIKEMEEK